MQATVVPESREARCRPRGRFGIAFGRRFFLLLAIGAGWIGPAFVAPQFLFAMVAWDVLLVAVWLVDLQRLPSPGQVVLRRQWSTPAALAVPANVEIHLANEHATALHAEIVDDVPWQLCPAAPHQRLQVAARSSRAGRYAIQPVRRGDIEIGQAYIRYESALRLAQRWAVAPIGQTVRVYPNLDEARGHAIYLARSRQIELEKRHTRMRGAGREFESLRDFRQGDELRDICWTATARRGKLVAKLYQLERSQTIWVVVDCGRLMRARVREFPKLDYAANAALGLAHVALWSGDRVGLLAYGRAVRHRLLPNRGSLHLRQWIEELATVQEETGEADHLHAAGALLSIQKRRSLVIWITDLAETAMTPEVIEAASQLMPRHLVLFVAIGQPDLAMQASREPETVSQMYEITAAQEMMHRRELLLARLRQQGALALETDSASLSTAVVNSYLEIKQRSRL